MFFAEITGVARKEAAVRAGALAGADGAGGPRFAARRRSLQRHAAESAVHRHHPARARTADPRRAVFGARPRQRRSCIKDIILEYHRRGHTIVFSTHRWTRWKSSAITSASSSRARGAVRGRSPAVKQQYGQNGVSAADRGRRVVPEVASRGGQLPGQRQRTVPAAARRRRSRPHPRRGAGAAHGDALRVAEPSIYDIFIERVSEVG